MHPTALGGPAKRDRAARADQHRGGHGLTLHTAGAPLPGAPAAVVLVHGRDQDAGFMLDVARRARLGDVALLAPEAPTRSWYPGRFFDPVAANEPSLTRAVDACEEAIRTAEIAGVPLERIVLCGFSQGACVVTEVVRRRPRPFGAVVVLTGALMGEPAAEEHAPSPAASLADLRVHVSCSRHDEWIPLEHALAAARWLERAGAQVTTAVSDEHEHHVSDAEAAILRSLVDPLVRAAGQW